MSALPPLALRMDDPGAATKLYCRYARKEFRWGPLRINSYFPPLNALTAYKGWGPYPELSPGDWIKILGLLEKHGARMTVAVTACWVESDARLVPFPEKFPRQAAILKQGVERNLIEIANHGLTHCVVQDSLFKPKLFAGNRKYHREFWDWLPDALHVDHVTRSQSILESWIGRPVISFVPPGNQFTSVTCKAASNAGLRFVSCKADPGERQGIFILGEGSTIPFHDRDIVMQGIDWFSRLLETHAGRQLVSVADLGAWRQSAGPS
jgi:peptidoglycan/xylan/chitin deacetylase (PgdA/CDA1 family)